MLASIILGVVTSLGTVGTEPVEIFSIGRIDGTPKEFALAPDGWQRYAATFQENVRFRVGSDAPARSFPYIHPGPVDAWGGSRSHAFRIEFELDRLPAGLCLLRIGICRSHYAYPPTFTIRANDTAAKAFMTERDGKNQTKYYRMPPGSLRAGKNALTLASQSGSWFQYDGLQLLAFPDGEAPEQITALKAVDTIFFRGEGEELRQIVRASVDGLWDGQGTFVVTAGTATHTMAAADCAVGASTFDLPLPPVAGKTPVTVELRTASGKTATASCTVTPHRPWRIFVAMKTHYDIGYTEPVEDMLNRAAGSMLDKVCTYCDETRGMAPGHRFVWTYPTWLIDEILKRKDAAGKKRFEEYLRRDEVVWNAMPFSIHTYFCGIEDMVRSLYGAKELDRRYGKHVAWAKQTDVPGHSRFLPQLCARSGIKLLQIGANNGVRGVKAPLVFWWESPDGSRVLTQLTAGYGWGWSNELLSRLETYVGYPYDAFLALYVTGDNVGPGDLIRVAKEAESLGKRYSYPKIQIGGVEAFAEYMEQQWRDRIPVVKTELADWWIHGVASQARVSALARWTRNALTLSERLHTAAVLGGVLGAEEYPADRFREAYIQSLLYSEHTWGISGFKPEPRPKAQDDLARNPKYDPMKKSWRIKGDYVRRAAVIARETLDAVVGRIAHAAATDGLVVFNPSSWPRTDIVRVPEGAYQKVTGFVPLDGGKPVPVQTMGQDTVFVARNVPATGYRVYKPAVVSSPEPAPLKRGVVESSFYRVRFDDTGEILSVVEKRSGKECIDGDAPFRLNQYIYEGYEKITGVGWHGSPYKGRGTGKVVPHTTRVHIESGPVGTRITVEGTLRIPDFSVQIGETKRVIRTVTVYHDLDRIDCAVTLEGKVETAVAEAGHVAFPFKVPDFRFKLELLGAVTDPVKDIQEAGNRDTFGVQNWVDVSGTQGGITWATVEAPLVSLGDIRIFSWDANYVPKRSHIYSNVLNNGWSTNFQEFQGGEFHFSYAFKAHGGSKPDARLGWEVANPFISRRVTRGNGTLEAASSFCEVTPASVVLINAKRADDGRGWVLRLFETAGVKTEARISSSLNVPGEAVISRMTEELPPEGGTRLAADADGIVTTIGPFEVQTIRIGAPLR